MKKLIKPKVSPEKIQAMGIIAGAILQALGLIVAVLVLVKSQNYQTKHDFYQMILKEQLDSDQKLLEITGQLISEDKASNRLLILSPPQAALTR